LEKWTVYGGILYTGNRSNLSIYEYDRRQITLNLAGHSDREYLLTLGNRLTRR